MEKWGKDARREAVIVDLDMLVPKDHLLRKIEKVMDYDWLYERLETAGSQNSKSILGAAEAGGKCRAGEAGQKADRRKCG